MLIKTYSIANLDLGNLRRQICQIVTMLDGHCTKHRDCGLLRIRIDRLDNQSFATKTRYLRYLLLYLHVTYSHTVQHTSDGQMDIRLARNSTNNEPTD